MHYYIRLYSIYYLKFLITLKIVVHVVIFFEIIEGIHKLRKFHFFSTLHLILFLNGPFSNKDEHFHKHFQKLDKSQERGPLFLR
jgi:hypothetical protein